MLLFMQGLSQAGQRTARQLYGCRGWCAHHGTDVWMNTAPTDGVRYGMSPLMGAWLCQTLWEHYAFDPDRAYLKRIYPILKGAARFALDFLIDEPRHNWLVTCPSNSPENAFQTADGQVSAVSVGPAIDSQILRDLFGQCIQATQTLGVDADLRAELEAARKRLPPHQIGKHGQLMEWLEDFDEPEVAHRHVSHLYAFYPSNQITLRGAPELAAAVRKVIERRGDKNTHGWSAAWKINLAARLGDSDEAYRIVRRMIAEISLHPSPEDSDRVPSMEGNQAIQGFTAGVGEMLLQSHAGELELLPALPKAWPAGHVQGLRARGGYEVDMQWTNGQLAQATLRSKYAAPCRLRTAQPITVSLQGQPVPTRAAGENTIEFDAAAGVYLITPQGARTN